MKAQLSKAKHRVVVEMDDAFMRMFKRVAKALHATTYSGAIRQLISEAARKEKKS